MQKLNTPLYHVAAGAVYEVNLATSASNVLMGDGASVESRLTQLERKANQAGLPLFVASETALNNLSNAQAGQLCFCAGNNALYLYKPDGVWLKIAQGAE